jgi:hypothetical protein
MSKITSFVMNLGDPSESRVEVSRDELTAVHRGNYRQMRPQLLLISLVGYSSDLLKRQTLFSLADSLKGRQEKNLEVLFNSKGYFRTASYIRWVANEECFMSRINDLADEGDTDGIFHWSATYRHLKWTFWCTQSDYQGTNADFSHFHVEMRLNGQIFIKFNDFHIPFTDKNLFDLKCNLDERSPIKQTFGSHGAGMNDAMSVPINKIISNSKIADDENQGTYRIETLVISEEGKFPPRFALQEKH